MSTSPDFIDYALDKLNRNPRFFTKAMFGEYCLYADGKVVALICDDTLFVKILPASLVLENICDKDLPYPKAKLHYAVTEEQFDSLRQLPDILFDISKSLPSIK